MSNKKSPVYDVKAVPVEKVVANDYNPNIVAPPEMKMDLRCLACAIMIRRKICISWWTVFTGIRY